LRLFLVLVQLIRRHAGCGIRLYARYHDSMISPALISLLFRVPLTIRTGPVLLNLEDHERLRGRKLLRFVANAFLAIHCRTAQHIIVVTQTISRWIQSTYPFTVGKIEVVHNAVNCEKFLPREPRRDHWGLPEQSFVLGFVGSLVPIQGLDTVIRAIALFAQHGKPVPRLLVLGDGWARQRWEELTAELGVNKFVIWAGVRNRDEVQQALACCDVAVLPISKSTIRDRGCSAIKLYEYLACDRFVLASRCEDLEFLENEQVGCLADPEDPQAWANAIMSLVEHGQYRMTGRARSVALRKFSYESLACRIWDVCFDATNG
jgi:glycosyltransferase involved in cell wall biosynthesis